MFSDKLKDLLSRKNPVEARIEAGLLMWEHASALLDLIEVTEQMAAFANGQSDVGNIIARRINDALRELDKGEA